MTSLEIITISKQYEANLGLVSIAKCNLLAFDNVLLPLSYHMIHRKLMGWEALPKCFFLLIQHNLIDHMTRILLMNTRPGTRMSDLLWCLYVGE